MYYDHEDGYWHERLLLAKVDRENWVVCTGDADLYEESLLEPLEVMQAGRRGGAPPVLASKKRVRLTAEVLDDAEGLLERGADIARDLLAEPGRAGVDAGTGQSGSGGGSAAQAAAGSTPRAVVQMQWVALETRGGCILGLGVPAGLLNAAGMPQQVFGDRGLVDLGAGKWLAVGHDGTIEKAKSDAAGSSDLRTLPVIYTASGDRERSFVTVPPKLTTTAFTDWRVRGPRTTQWLLGRIAGSGSTPAQRHF